MRASRIRITLRGQSKLERLLDGEGRVMLIALGVVDDLAGEALPKLNRLHTSVCDLAVDGEIAVPLVSNGFEECGTPRARPAKNEDHFAGTNDAVKALQDLLRCWLEETKLGPDNEQRRQEELLDRVRECAEVQLHAACSHNLQVGEGNAGSLASRSAHMRQMMEAETKPYDEGQHHAQLGMSSGGSRASQSHHRPVREEEQG
jgi:hypothetical protein